MSILSLREYEKLFIGERTPDVRSVTLAESAQLRALKKRHGFDVFKLVNENTLAAQQYVGVTQIGSLTVEILPKVEGIEGTLMRRNLVGMLAAVMDLDVSDGDAARVASQQHSILEILIRLFCDKLFLQVHRGLLRRYEDREENLPVLRGRIDVINQIRMNAANQARLYCRFDEFEEDNPLNQILKAAIRLLLKVSRDLANQRRLGELLLILEGVSDVPTALLPWHRVRFDRLSDRYFPTFRLAELFLKATPPDVTGGMARGFSLFFEMNTLFEEYVGRVAQRIFRADGYKVALQGPQRWLAYDEGLARQAFALRPDVVGLRGLDVAWVVDTKWKELSTGEVRDGVLQADMYQMYAYSSSFHCPEVILLYPHHAGLGAVAGVRAVYRICVPGSAGHEQRRIKIATVDLSDLSAIPRQLRTILGRLGEFAAKTG